MFQKIEIDVSYPAFDDALSLHCQVTPRPRRPRAIQANTALILRAMADAHKSVNRPSHHSREREKVEKQKPRKKHKVSTTLFSKIFIDFLISKHITRLHTFFKLVLLILLSVWS